MLSCSTDSISKLTISSTVEHQQPDMNAATSDTTQNVQETDNNSTSEEQSEKISIEEHMAYMQMMESGENGDEDTTKAIGEQCQCKLFIGGLSWDTNEQALRDHFEQFGEVFAHASCAPSATPRMTHYNFIGHPSCVFKAGGS